ncbi:hypothetical protein [Phenylobacterium sp.]|uniref:hypothetical protein n=1 Tax=Phenylobacterium sp. TaxID=1871053 RepID=UPI0025D01186|nr:hypothetical protein [Phenylobacterium sp.]MBX3485731.1 hypothetical protein [Phenylobacterium sp.]MCW5759071.1 hypothetical protein [Phenylobacterium sp.]
MLTQIAALAVVGAAATFALVVAGLWWLLSQAPTSYVYEIEPSPDRTISLVTEASVEVAPTADTAYDVYLVGGAFTPRVQLGRYFHGGPEAGDGWREDRRVNVCMLRYPFTGPGDAAELVANVKGARGDVASVRVTKDCPPPVLKSWKWRWG